MGARGVRGPRDNDLCRGVSALFGPGLCIDLRLCELWSLLTGDLWLAYLDLDVALVGDTDGEGVRDGAVVR